MIKKIFKLLSNKQIASLAFMVILLFVGGLFDMLGVSMILPIVNLLIDETALAGAEWAIWLSDVFHLRNTRSLVVFLMVAMMLVYIIKNIYVILMHKLLFYFTYKFKRDFAMRLLNCYMYQDYTFHLNKNVADLQRNVLTDTGLFFDFISDALNLMNQCVICIFLSVYLLVVDWQTTITVVFILGGAILLVYKYQRKSQEKRGIENRESNAALNKWIIQSFNGIKEIQVAGKEEYFLHQCQMAYDKGMDANKKSNLAALIPKPLMEMVCVSGLLGVIAMRLLIGADLDKIVPTLAVFAVAAFRILPCFNTISAYISRMLFEKQSVDAVYNDIQEMENLGQIRHKVKSEAKITFDNAVTVHNVSFYYPNNTKLILDDVSLEIKKNQSVGFMGSSGAGKSTLIDIILGVLPVSAGKICVDGQNIYECLNGWHNLVGYIPQSIYLMDDTIRHNVAFGIAEDQISDTRLWQVLEEAQIGEFVRSLPDGLDTEIGDRGVRLSGGQRQRLGIARALYHNPEILVFDEATSALDNDTETALMEAINGLKGTRTMLIIAHRLHTIENCDVIIEVVNGKLVQRDTI